METLIKKTKKLSTKEIIRKVETGKLTGDSLQAAIEVLKMRNVSVNIPVVKIAKTENQEKTTATSNKHPLAVGDKVSFSPAKNSPLKNQSMVTGTVVKAFSNPTQHWVRIKLENGTKVYKLSTACTKVN